jgi:4-hydroxy-tetrahydrodipicolinate reductase
MMTRLALVGMGKMGQTIKSLALQHNFAVVHEIDSYEQLIISDLSNVDVAIEFSTPHAAEKNIIACLASGVPVICGTTGWLDQLSKVENFVRQKKGTFLYASNFSVGMNITFQLNRQLAQFMKAFPDFKPSLKEIHHVHKLDQPSGTAKTLADDLVKILPGYEKWKLKNKIEGTSKEVIPIDSLREGEVNGIHEVVFRSDSEEVMIRHDAFDRTIFAKGALMAAQWIKDKKGIFTFSDLLNFKDE